jgi:hypothetical protein
MLSPKAVAKLIVLDRILAQYGPQTQDYSGRASLFDD